MQRISITIDDYLKQELDSITAKGESASFVIQAIKKAIEERHRQQALEKIMKFKPYKIQQDSLDVLADVRKRLTQ
jgi:metal-responsive CopG/Arc/MetJ family transcriptional regulator